MSKTIELRERIARIIHAEWVRLMQKTIAETPAEYNDLSSKLYLKKHWENVWKPYDRVSERDRTHAREMADKVLDVFFSCLDSLREDIPMEDKNGIQKPSTKGSIKVRHVILMLLDAHGGGIRGKNRIHAEIYLLHVMFFSIFRKLNLTFRTHYYHGYPYSSEVSQAIDESVGAGFITKSFCCDIPGLTLLEAGERLVKELKTEYAEEYEAIKQFVEKLGDAEGAVADSSIKAVVEIVDRLGLLEENKAKEDEDV